MSDSIITESTGYFLVQACKAHRQKAADLLAQLELFVGQEMFLLHLWQEDGLTQSELAESMCIQPATLTRMLDRMAKSGLVERRKDAEDQRLSRVYLTERGHALRKPVEETWWELERISMAGFTQEERILLRRLLLQLIDNLNR